LQDVPEVVSRDDVRLATLLGLVQTEESDDVGRIGVEELSSGGAASYTDRSGAAAKKASRSETHE
jgi:hypothetical protein